MFKLGSKNKESNNAPAGRGPTRVQEKLAKRILGKDTGRHVFGFPCIQDLHAEVKIKAGELQVPIFALAEHCLELGLDTIADIDDSEERDQLRKHLIEHHVDPRTIEKINWYDEELAKEISEERIRRFEIERATRRLVSDFARRGMNPKYMPYYLDYGYRCFAAFVNGLRVPNPPSGIPGGEQRPSRSQATTEKEDEADDNSPKNSG